MQRFTGFWPALMMGAFLGCGSAPQHPHEESEPLLQVLTAYIEATRVDGRPPRDEVELRKHLPDADVALVSPRDHKHYVVRWGVNVNDPQLNPADPPIIAYEQVGKDGVRHAITAMGLAHLSEEQFQKLPKE